MRAWGLFPIKGASISKTYPSIKELSDEQRIRLVRRIFNSITGRYDFLNHFLSAGRDKKWREFLVSRLRFFATHRLLDLATGTGDIALAAAQTFKEIQVLGLDFAESMLREADRKSRQANLARRIDWVQGDALHLPFPKESFDAVSIGFGIRNMPDRRQVYQEILRVLVPGGKLCILELTTPQSRFFRGLYLMYLQHLLPRLARWFTPDPPAYYYLAESILHFPGPAELLAEMKAAGFLDTAYYPLTLGITCLHEGTKPLSGNSP